MKIYGVDQSLAGFAHCVLEDGEIKLIETLNPGERKGMERVEFLSRRFKDVVVDQMPDIIVIEDYAFGANTNTITQLAELAGVLKMTAHEYNYGFGWDVARQGKKAVVIQTQSRMKKFCLGSGATKKDSRYLLTVMERVHKSFNDDNQADAYMHAWSAGIIHSVLTGRAQIGDLPAHQQEALLADAVKKKKGLSITKAMKLGDDQKQLLLAA